MQSRTDIANQALAFLSGGTISNLDDADTKAVRIKAVFDSEAKKVIRLHRWSCCIARETLSQISGGSTSNGSFGYSYKYALPTDCLRFLDLNGEPWANKSEFMDINGRDLLTNASEARIRYVKWESDVSKWDPLLAEAVAAKIAAKVARAITSDGISAEDLHRIYQHALKEAQSVDAMEIGSGENRPIERMIERSPLVREGRRGSRSFRAGQILGLNVSSAEDR